MTLELEIEGSTAPAARYVSYAPAPCVLRQVGGKNDFDVTLTSRAAVAGGGELSLYDAPDKAGADTLALTVPVGAPSRTFWIGGKFQRASKADGDCLLVATTPDGDETFPLMVRVRKNANRLESGERDRFLHALKAVNRAGMPVYQDFRDMHVDEASPQEHQGPQFLPWHRAYLLDLERELQRVDASVSLHYWRFDEPAPTLFTAAFLGPTYHVAQGTPARQVVFPAGHPLAGWATDGVPGIMRSSLFDTQLQSAQGVPGFPMRSQADTLALGSAFTAFRAMEGRPHGAAHVSFEGFLSQIGTAAKDPLFFLLHSNVDRLWALWQWLNARFNPDSTLTYQGQDFDGRRLDDTLWPWNDVKTPPRPPFAPRGVAGLAATATTSAPGARPTLRGVLDFQGSVLPTARLGYDYDDVPFEPRVGGPIP